jgi:hypothetical protein
MVEPRALIAWATAEFTITLEVWLCSIRPQEKSEILIVAIE